MPVRRFLTRLHHLRHNLRILLQGTPIRLTTYVGRHPTSQLHLARTSRFSGRALTVGERSVLSIGAGAIIDGNVMIGDDCTVRIDRNFKLLNGASLIVDDHGQVQIDKDCLVEAVSPFRACLRVVRGSARLCANANLRGEVLVQEGQFWLGANSFVNHGTEIRCDERVRIGDYVFVSYFVDIYDSNTHSLDWRERQQEVEDGYPNRTVHGRQYVEMAPVELGDHVWVGKRAAILKGCSLGARSVVGTRAVVTASCPEGSLLVGNPASVQPLCESDGTS